mgnify:CR=1 FL=1
MWDFIHSENFISPNDIATKLETSLWHRCPRHPYSWMLFPIKYIQTNDHENLAILRSDQGFLIKELSLKPDISYELIRRLSVKDARNFALTSKAQHLVLAPILKTLKDPRDLKTPLKPKNNTAAKLDEIIQVLTAETKAKKKILMALSKNVRTKYKKVEIELNE